jgi:hypothetical protein
VTSKVMSAPLPSVRHDDLARATQLDQLLDEMAHEAGADDDHVVAQPDISELDGVRRTGHGFEQRLLQRHVA